MLLALTGGVPGFTSIALPKSFRSMSICKVSMQKPVRAPLLKLKTSMYMCAKSHTLQYLAGGRLHHVVVGAHDASIWLGDRRLSVDVGGLGLGRSGRQRQEGLAPARAKVWQGQLGTGQRDRHLEKDSDTQMLHNYQQLTDSPIHQSII